MPPRSRCFVLLLNELSRYVTLWSLFHIVTPMPVSCQAGFSSHGPRAASGRIPVSRTCDPQQLDRLCGTHQCVCGLGVYDLRTAMPLPRTRLGCNCVAF